MSDKEYKGLFIVFEGPDGVGKTTQIHAVADQLRSIGWSVITTREPGGSEFGESVRNLIMKSEISKRTETLLFAAARSHHLEKTIKPNVNNGVIVLCDRYIMSSMVYQGIEGGQSKLVEQISEHFTEDFKPHMTFVLNAPLEEVFNRKNSMDESQINRLDPDTIEQSAKRKGAYHVIASEARADEFKVGDKKDHGFGKVIPIHSFGNVDEVTCAIANEITSFDAQFNNSSTRRVFCCNSDDPKIIGRRRNITNWFVGQDKLFVGEEIPEGISKTTAITYGVGGVSDINLEQLG